MRHIPREDDQRFRNKLQNGDLAGASKRLVDSFLVCPSCCAFGLWITHTLASCASSSLDYCPPCASHHIFLAGPASTSVYHSFHAGIPPTPLAGLAAPTPPMLAIIPPVLALTHLGQMCTLFF
eukprot:1137545-Pelagomonas_calceolata.AAC.3